MPRHAPHALVIAASSPSRRVLDGCVRSFSSCCSPPARSRKGSSLRADSCTFSSPSSCFAGRCGRCRQLATPRKTLDSHANMLAPQLVRSLLTSIILLQLNVFTCIVLCLGLVGRVAKCRWTTDGLIQTPASRQVYRPIQNLTSYSSHKMRLFASALALATCLAETCGSGAGSAPILGLSFPMQFRGVAVCIACDIRPQPHFTYLHYLTLTARCS